ncbi:MAG: DUF899 family protein [Proteobacteria bacterium]|nr:DUF899 family protein [Pseudomonadota bacterium]
MADVLHHLSFPNETQRYREARNELLAEEMELRRHLERVAARRRLLPLGGEVPEDYAFDAPGGQRRKFSELFEKKKDTLAVYSFMYGPERARPCPGCTHFLDGLDGSMPHILERINFVVVVKSPIERIVGFAKERGWRHLSFLSAAGNSYSRDYFGDSTSLSPQMRVQQEFKDGEEWDMPILNVFRRQGGPGGDTIRHFWGSEMLYVPPEAGQQYRHNDLLDPLWNMLDLSPEGRGDFEPKLVY